MPPTIEDGGKWQFTLTVTDGEVIARQPIPYDGVLVYSTEDRPNRLHKNSEYQLDAREVVRRFVAESDTDREFGELVDEVQAAIVDVGGDASTDTDGREEPTRSEPADFGHGESTGVQEL